MQYITIVSDTYEKALDEAKRKYGDALRVHSRREYTVGGGLFTRKRHKCELTCYLVEPRAGERKAKKEETVTRQDLAEFEKEAQTPDPSRLSEAERLDTAQPARQLEGERRVHDILDLNGIRLKLRDHILDGFEPSDDLDLALSDRIISSVEIDHENQAHPRRYQVFLGPTGSGKTTTLAKIASLYKTVGKDVGIICLDSYRVGAFEQVKAFADAFSIPAVLVKDEDAVLLAKDGMRDKDLVLVDTMGLSPNDIPLNLKLRGLLALFEAAELFRAVHGVGGVQRRCGERLFDGEVHAHYAEAEYERHRLAEAGAGVAVRRHRDRHAPVDHRASWRVGLLKAVGRRGEQNSYRAGAPHRAEVFLRRGEKVLCGARR